MKTLAGATVLLLAVSACNHSTQSPKGTNVTETESSVSANQESLDAEQGHRASDVNQPNEQEKNPTDQAISAKIQKQLVDSKMAVNLESVKVSTRDGKVTLTGMVKTAEEKQNVEQIANSAAGDGNVLSQLEVEQ